MPDVFDGTNPITDILGDEPTERNLTFENQSVQNFIEPLTNTAIPAGQTVELTVIGDMAHSTLVKNIQQINALQGFEVVGLTSIVIPDEPVAGGLLLIPNGATESADGEYQRFTHDGTGDFGAAAYTAGLPESDWRSAFVVQLIAPEVVAESQILAIYFAAAAGVADVNDTNFVKFEILTNGLTDTLVAQLAASEGFAVPLAVPTPGSLITLTLSQTALDVQYNDVSESRPIEPEFFASAVNCLVFSADLESVAVLPMSIKVAEAP